MWKENNYWPNIRGVTILGFENMTLEIIANALTCKIGNYSSKPLWCNVSTIESNWS